jgi:hypothetical protein
MMLGLVQLLVGFVVAWEAVELVLRHGLVLSVFKLAILAALAAAAGCVAVMYVRSPLFVPFLPTMPHRTNLSPCYALCFSILGMGWGEWLSISRICVLRTPIAVYSPGR